jgi:hypothetical protein
MNSSEKGRKSSMNKLLPMLSVFSEWATLYSDYMLPFEGKENSLKNDSSIALPSIISSINQRYDADKDVLRSELRARSGMRYSSSLFIKNYS